MNPIPVDQLFIEQPALFAYQPRPFTERNEAKPGDLVKLFFQLEEHLRPRPIWLTVDSVVETENGRSFTGKAWDRYPDAKRRRFGTVRFDATHVYRLPVKESAEIDNPSFDVEYRDERRIAG